MKLSIIDRDRLASTRVSSAELARWHALCERAGVSLSELLRESVRHYARVLERDLEREPVP